VGAFGVWFLDSLRIVSVALKTNLEGYWSLDDTSGSLVDSHGSNTLTNNNTIGSATGKISNAGLFATANSEYASIASNASVQVSDIDFTVGCWVYMNTKAAVQAFVAKFNTTGNQRQYLLNYTTATDRFRFSVSVTGSSTLVTVDADVLGSPSTGAWYFLLGWHDSVNNEIGIQVNNATANTTSHSGGVFATGTSDFYIGGHSASSAFADARIDEVFFSKKIFTAGEKTEIYNSGNGLAYSSWDAAAGLTYTQIERQIRGLNRGVYSGC